MLIQIQSCLLAIQDSSKYPPFFLKYGRYATLPIDILSKSKMEPLWHGHHRVWHEDLGDGHFKLCLVDDCSKILAQKYNVKQVRCIHNLQSDACYC